MTKEKEVLMKTLKDENLRAETRKFTGNLLNKPKVSNTSILSNNNNNKINSNLENKTEPNINVNNLNKDIKTEKSSVKKKKKIKKKKKEDSEKILKSGDQIVKGQKYKLLTKNEKSNNENIIKEYEKDNNKNINENKNEVKPIIKDNENKTNKSRKEFLNSLNNLQYNFDNLMAIGVHGTKILNNNKI